MALHQDFTTVAPPKSRYEIAFDRYLIALSVLMMLLGLRQWSIILGLWSGPEGTFEVMPMPWKIATMNLAVADLVASVGLWMRAAWGKVIWIYAALSEIALHTVLIGTFGGDMLMVVLHVVTLAAFVAFVILGRRRQRT